MSQPVRLLYIALSPPSDATSGTLLMHRHLQALGERAEIAVLHTDTQLPPAPGVYCLPVRRLYERLLRTRFHERVRALEHTRGLFYSRRAMKAVIRRVRPDAILAVPEESLHLTVRAVARSCGVPVVSVFHDWAPGWPGVPPACRQDTEAAFRRFHRESVASLCVSPELLEHLGPHPGAAVLYPVPDPQKPVDPPLVPAGNFHVLYAGAFYSMYAVEMKALCRELAGTPSAAPVRVLGPDPRWPEEDMQLLRRVGIYQGFFKGAEFRARLAAAPALLVISSFTPEWEAYARYSFPSKIPEYCRYGRPIVIWGPPYAASVAWGRRSGAALVVDDPSPAALLAALRELERQPELQLTLAHRAAHAAATEFDPGRLQAVFEAGLRRAVPHLARA